jgi:hypothetical protein
MNRTAEAYPKLNKLPLGGTQSAKARRRPGESAVVLLPPMTGKPPLWLGGGN